MNPAVALRLGPPQSMKHVVAHNLPVDVAKRLSEHAFASYRRRYNHIDLQLRWLDDSSASVSFEAKGAKLVGRFEIWPQRFVFEMRVPWLLRLFQNRAVGVIEREVRFWLREADAGRV